jgi:peptidyl-prolyl cis-trans isomerase D
MFESIRNQRRWLMPLLTLVVFVPFVFSGVYGLTRFMGDDNSVASVDGEPISQQELDNAHRERVERMMQMLGPSVDAKVFDSPQMRASTLDNLLSDKSLEHEVERMRLSISDARLRELIATIPQFQVDGHFDYETYKRLLASRGFTEASFEARVRTDAGRQALESGVVSGAMVPRTVVERLRALDNERRQVRRLVFRPDDFLAQTSVTDEAVKADYDANRDRYRTPEQAKVQYLVLRLDDIAARTPVAEAALKAYYEANLARWGEPEQRRASHILVTFGKGGSAPDKAGARALAEDLLRQVRARPGDFARLAREKSKDPGSADKGGDLGWFGRAMMTKPFEDAVFALHEGQISDVVETDFGFHIIELTGIKGGKAQAFEQVRGTIEAEMRKQAAQKTYADLAEQFTNVVYEQADDLAPAAAKFQLQLQTVDGLTRAGAPKQADKSAIFTPQVLDAVFAPDSIDKHHNTKAIDVGNSTLVSVHVLAYTPSAVRPLAEVSAQIKARLQRSAAAQLARAAGERRLAQLKAAPDDAGFEPVHELARRDTSFLAAPAIASIMAVPQASLPAYVGVDQADGGYALIHVLSASVVEGSDADGAAKEKTLRDETARADRAAFVQALRERFGARITRPDLLAAEGNPAKR